MSNNKIINIIYIAKCFPGYGADVNTGGARLIHGMIVNACMSLADKKYFPTVLTTETRDADYLNSKNGYVHCEMNEKDIVEYLRNNNRENTLLYFIDSLFTINNPDLLLQIIEFWKGKLIFRPQELDKINSMKEIYGKDLGMYLSKFSVLISQSDEITKSLLDLGIKHKKICQIDNGVDLNVFYPSKNRSESRSITYVYSGRLFQPKKRVVDLIKAWRLSNLSGGGHRLLLIGPVDRGIPGINRLNKLKKEGVTLIGSLKQDKLAEILRSADVFILPSIPEGEGFSNSLLEAGASGNVLVARRGISGANRLIEEGKTGFYFDDIKSLAKLMINLQDQKLRNKVSNKSTELIYSSFTLEKMAKKHLALYEDLVN